MNICVYEYRSILSFGKYKYKNLLEISKLSISYIDWCLTSINNFCVSEKSMRIIMKQPNIKLSNKAIKANQFKLEIDKLNGSEVDEEIYDEILIELYEIYNKNNEINNISIWD